MKATLADPSLVRQAGRFVWLELDYDKPVNQPFIARRGVAYTPSIYILDAADERATASHMGGLTLAELNAFLDHGERVFRGKATTPADAALARADDALGHGKIEDAAVAYREAVGLAPKGWSEKPRALGSLTWALWMTRQSQAAAETAAAEAPGMARGSAFVSMVLAGFASSNQGGSAPWADSTRNVLEPLAEEAVTVMSGQRDHRYQLYQQLLHFTQLRGDTTGHKRWGHQWLDEIEALHPKDDDERSALDIARVDAASDIAEPERVIPALIESEKAMPTSYNTSLRLAQMEVDANRNDEALAAVERGLAHVTGPVGRSWLLSTKGNALYGKGDKPGARAAFEEALTAAKEIGNESNRANNLRNIGRAIATIDKETGATP